MACRRAFLPLSILALAACSAEEAGTARASVPVLSIAEDLRIDGYAEDLVPIGWVGASPNGVIAMLQWQDFGVRFYAPSGEFLGSVGREGAGPGEFRRVVRAGWIADTLWVSDTQLRRTTLISPDLEVVRTVPDHGLAQPMPGDTMFPTYRTPNPFAMYADGGSLTWALQRTDGQFVDLQAGSPLLRLDSAGFIERRVAGVVSLSEGYITVDVGNGVGSAIPFFHSPSGPYLRTARASER